MFQYWNDSSLSFKSYVIKKFIGGFFILFYFFYSIYFNVIELCLKKIKQKSVLKYILRRFKTFKTVLKRKKKRKNKKSVQKRFFYEYVCNGSGVYLDKWNSYLIFKFKQFFW